MGLSGLVGPSKSQHSRAELPRRVMPRRRGAWCRNPVSKHYTRRTVQKREPPLLRCTALTMLARTDMHSIQKRQMRAATRHTMRRLAPRGGLSRARQKNGWGRLRNARARELEEKPRCVNSAAARASAAGPCGDCAR